MDNYHDAEIPASVMDQMEVDDSSELRNIIVKNYANINENIRRGMGLKAAITPSSSRFLKLGIF